MEKHMVIGSVMGSHGIKGELKIKPLTDDLERFYDLSYVLVCQQKKITEYTINHVRIHKNIILLTLEGINDRNTSDLLRGASIEIRRKDAVNLEVDEFFITDLIGLQIVSETGDIIGTVNDVLQTTGSVDTLEIQMPNKKIYVPFRGIYFPDVDILEGKIIANIPEDLMNL